MEKAPQSLAIKYLYYQLHRPDIDLHLELPSQDLGIYVDGDFISLLDETIEKDATTPPTYHAVPKIKTVIFLDALYQASQGMEPFLSISTRLFKLIVDDHQEKAADLDLDEELYNKIKVMYWGIIQEKAADELINKGFELVMNKALEICKDWMLTQVLGQ